MLNIIFDFGNVLVRFAPEAVYAAMFGDEARSWWFLRHVATADWRSHIDAGMSQQKAIDELCAKWPDYSDAIRAYQERWREMLPGEVEGMRQLLSELKAREDIRLFGLTNWSMETFPEARQRFEILQMIEHYVVSGEEGLVKPDHQLFRVLLDRYHLRAEDCIFVDDNEANVRAASELGMRGIVFRGVDQLRQSLGLGRPLSAQEIDTMVAQGCWAERWGQLRVSDGFEATRVHASRFYGEVYIGSNTTIEISNISNCRIGDGCHLRNVHWMENYHLAANCTVDGVGRMVYNAEGVCVDVMNENGGRGIGLSAEMTVGDAYLWAKYRDRAKLMQRFAEWQQHRGYMGSGSSIVNATTVCDGIIGAGCRIDNGVIAERFLLGENVHLEAGLRLNDSVVGDNSTLARGEVGCSLIFPAHEQHHNNSFLIASLVMGQSNVAAGATLGSNHNGRTADGEMAAGRGFWPGLCVSIKHNCRFASYTLLSKGDYPNELNITLPFSLVNNNVAKNRLEVMPAYWWLYNMYALERNRTKFASRDKRISKRQHIEFAPLAPDTAEEIIMARDLLRTWTTQSYHHNGSTTVIAHGMERGSRDTVILKPSDGYRAYEEMLIYYAMQHLDGSEHYDGKRSARWVNIGGQLLRGEDADCLLNDIESGKISSWNMLHQRLNDLWTNYPEQRRCHAYQVLCHLAQKSHLAQSDWDYFRARYAAIKQLVQDRITVSRQKDMDNEFRQTTFLNASEMNAVIKQ